MTLILLLLSVSRRLLYIFLVLVCLFIYFFGEAFCAFMCVTYMCVGDMENMKENRGKKNGKFVS